MPLSSYLEIKQTRNYVLQVKHNSKLLIHLVSHFYFGPLVYTNLPETSLNGHDLLSRLHCVRSVEGAAGLPQPTMSRMMV